MGHSYIAPKDVTIAGVGITELAFKLVCSSTASNVVMAAHRSAQAPKSTQEAVQ